MSGIVNSAADSLSDRDFHIRGIENDVGVVAAEFEEDVLKIMRAAFHKFSADGRRTREAYAVNVGRLRKPSAYFSAAARDKVANACGNARFEKKFGKHHRSHRSIGRGFDYNGIACYDNGRDLMSIKFYGEIERGDRGKYADGLSDGENNVALSSRLCVKGYGIAVKMTCGFEERLKNHAKTFKFASCVGYRFSALCGHNFCNLFKVFTDISDKSFDYRRSFVKRGCRPSGLRRFRYPCGFFKIFRSTARDFANKFAGIGVDVVKSLA